MTFPLYASVDIGTNTILLLIARLEKDGVLIPVHQEQRFPRLGRGLRQTGRLHEEGIRRALEFLREYQEIARSYGVKWMRVVATAAVREAANGEELVRRARDELGIQVEVISPEEEARLAFLGALSNKPELTGKVVVVDIGGGSTEFVWGSPGQVDGWISYPIGSVKLTEEFGLQARSAVETVQRAARRLRGFLPDSPPLIPDHLIGTAGTFTTLAAILLELKRYDADAIDGFHLQIEMLQRLIERLRGLDARDRLELPGIDPGREDVILGGAIIAREVMRYFGKREAIVSDRGLRYGAILDRLTRERRGR